MRSGFPLAFAGQSIGLLGGSFDPPHEGHVAITRAALRGFGLDRVWWLVSPGNPLKAHGPMPLEHRITAARKLLRDPRVVVTAIEARLGTRMTADTIAALQKHYPGVRFVWLMGSDNLMQFDRWDRWREIAERVPIGVLSRPGSQLAARRARAAQILAPWRIPARQAGKLAQMRPPAWAILDLPRNPASSTALRAAAHGVPPLRSGIGRGVSA
ncbi:nicotinate-nucleotide adenylyltransferase [Paracoccus suum]|uniref:Probable nicotinate-nucleotide adenylyltransferase n=1 Tax=Paracoccus suum TaxID=2259340 RepID=A0A344PL79_9RHOB|nr:nicotinate-nucleotide adenylyltransferase [Paracoccus suum]AXC50134.1 nicotinate-nucleotide adenylyltransferase [Paracoccus suum]